MHAVMMTQLSVYQIYRRLEKFPYFKKDRFALRTSQICMHLHLTHKDTEAGKLQPPGLLQLTLVASTVLQSSEKYFRAMLSNKCSILADSFFG